VCCSILQCVTVCCSVLQHIAVCYSVLQCVAVCCSVLQRVTECCSVLQFVAACCSVLQSVAVCCSLSYRAKVVAEDITALLAHLLHLPGGVSVRCSVLQCAALYRSVLQRVAACRSVSQRVAACCSASYGAKVVAEDISTVLTHLLHLLGCVAARANNLFDSKSIECVR